MLTVMRIGLDASYSIGDDLSGVGVYSRELIAGLATHHPEADYRLFYRAHMFRRALNDRVPPGCRRRLLHDLWASRSIAVFHGLNQRLPGRPFRRSVATFHDLFVLTGEYSSPEFRRRFERQAREAASRADLIVTVSEFTAGQVEDLLGIERSRIRPIPHGVRFPVAQRAVAARTPEKMVLHVGAIQIRKNVGRLVKAFERMSPEWRLVLAGSAGYGGAKILETIERSPARARIEAPGYISDDRLRELYGRAAIFAFPSLDEGFGMPVLEAMAWGIPVVTSNRSALPEVAGNAAVLIDPSSADEMAEALVELASNDSLRQELGRLGRERAAAFRWETAVEKTWAVYKELAP